MRTFQRFFAAAAIAAILLVGLELLHVQPAGAAPPAGPTNVNIVSPLNATSGRVEVQATGQGFFNVRPAPPNAVITLVSTFTGNGSTSLRPLAQLDPVKYWPHWSAILKENGTGQQWAVDRWPFDQGENPAVQKVEEWYIPDDGSDPTKPRPTRAPQTN